MNKIKCLSTLDIKLIAIITMIIDHFGYFFSSTLDNGVVIACRLIGRISMPLFAFLIYNGFKNTKNIDKYILRVFKCAVFTQIICVLLGILLNKIRSNTGIYFYREMNILFSFTIDLLFLKILDYFIKNKNKKIINSIGAIGLLVVLASVFFIVDIDYSFLPSILIIGKYLFDIMLKKTDIIFTGLILADICAMLLYFSCYFEIAYLITLLLVSIFYNGKKKYKSNKIFYFAYPVQYTVFLMLKIFGL